VQFKKVIFSFDSASEGKPTNMHINTAPARSNFLIKTDFIISIFQKFNGI
jgi:hypothetical protein